MSRDHRKLKIFEMAHRLVVQAYARTQGFPGEERYGLQSQLRRAAVSVSTNIVEGCGRKTTKDFAHFVTIALASATEVRYLVELSHELGFITRSDHEFLFSNYDELIRAIQSFINFHSRSGHEKSSADER